MSNEENYIADTIAGTLLGALIGGGLGLCSFFLDEPLFFAGDIVVFGAITCGVLGFFLGGGFIEWLKENWLHFW